MIIEKVRPSPSNLNICVKGCTAYPSMSKTFRKETGIDQEEGIKFHNVMEQVVFGEGGIPEEMFEHVIECKRYIESRDFSTCEFVKEEKLDLSELGLTNGYVDFAGFSPSENVIYIIDYKFGRKIVEAKENWQLLAYAIGMAPKFYNANEKTKVKLVIMQPQGFHPDGTIREWELPLTELPRYEKVIKRASHIAVTNPVYKTGSYCKSCPAILNCPASIEMLNYSSEILTDIEPFTISDEEIVTVKRLVDFAYKLAEGLKTQIDSEIKHRLELGATVPKATIKTSKTLKWVKDLDPIMLNMVSGVDVLKAPQCETYLKVIKKYGRDFEEVFRPYISEVITKKLKIEN